MNKASWQKWLFVIVGIFSVGLGLIGVFVPLLPTTPFLLLAAACFMRSSDRLYEWLITHRWLGSYIRNYREHRAITRRMKIATLVLLWGTIGYTALEVITLWSIRALLLLVGIAVTVHISSMNTIKQENLLKSGGIESKYGRNDNERNH